MKSREIKLIMETLAQLSNISKGLDINKEAIHKHSSTLSEVRKKLGNYTDQYNNTEYMKTLSPPEQQNLMTNARALYEVHEKLLKELDYLDMTKQPSFVTKAVSALDKAYLLSQYIYKEIAGECGDIVLPHLTCIQLKNVDKATYKQMIFSLMSELEAYTHDIYQDYIDDDENKKSLFPIFPMVHAYMVEAYMWFQKEKERVDVEPVPEITKIDIPAETVLEVPKQPEDVKETVQDKA